MSAETILASLWPQVRESIADVAADLRVWQRGGLDNVAAGGLAHRLAGTLGSYRRHEAGDAARRLELRLANGDAERHGSLEESLISTIEAAVHR
jgi:hypothetical protein